MFKNLLVGVDGRQGGRDAVALAKQLSDAQSTVTLAHVHNRKIRPSHAVTPGIVDEDREASSKLLEDERAAAEIDAHLVSVEAMSPGAGLHMQAELLGADLLVVGSCSRGIFARVMLGDDTRAALNGAPCAVAVAALGHSEEARPLTTIGVGYNGTPESEAALHTARELARATNARISALEVVTLPPFASGWGGTSIGESLNLMLDEAEQRLGELPDVDGHAEIGLTGEELSRFGKELDLLVIGSRGYGPLKRLVLGTTAQSLQRHAQCSLLVLPRAASEEPGKGSAHLAGAVEPVAAK
ncbi:MAG TPA: universal stress protein [Solirubrobacteraceae bacterium]|nr:universal stress protein [Solirubrobacteraceae bacterium]